MPRRCSICTHPARQAIDKAIAGGAAFPRVAAEWGVSTHAVGRHHRAGHIVAKVAKSAAAAEIVEADDLLQQVRDLQRDARRIGTRAEQEGDLRAALMAIDKIGRLAELLARLLGEINDAAQVNVAVGVAVESAADYSNFTPAQLAVVGDLYALACGQERPEWERATPADYLELYARAAGVPPNAVTVNPN